MRILHVITTLDVGGAEMHLLSQVRGQVAAGHDVQLAYLKGAGTLEPEFRAAGASAVTDLGGLFRAPLRLARLVRRVDLVHSHLLKADALTAAVATLAGRRRRLVSGKHNDERALKHPLVSLVHGVVGNLPVRTIALSDHVAGYVERFGRVKRERIERIYYGLDPGPFERAAAAPAAERAALRASLGFTERDVVFVCVARFAPQKAHDVLLRAFATAHARDERLRLLLVGGDPFGDGVERARAIAGELRLGAEVVFAGIRRDVPELLAASDVFVMASLWEGLGLVFLEAMAAGLPVLATDVSAVPEVVVDGRTGRLVPPSDADALARGFLELAADPALRARLASAGRERVREGFSLERMWRETLALYEEVTTAAERGRSPS